MLATLNSSNTSALPESQRAAAFYDNIHNGVSRFTLDNGLKVILKSDPAAPMVSIQFWVGIGSAHEQEFLGAGLSHLVEHMIFKGTPTRGPAKITKEINDAGGLINAYTSMDRTVFFVDLPAANWHKGFDVLSDAVKNAAFPDDEWQNEKEVILREMAMCNDDPSREATQLLLETAYRVHPYRVPVIGYEDIFKKLSREDLVLFFERHYTPDNMILVIAGNFEAQSAKKLVESTFANFSRRSRPVYPLPAEPRQISSRSLTKEGLYQVGRFARSWHTVSIEHPDTPALDLLATIAGDGRSSRLIKNLVERKKLAHAINAWSFTLAEPGVFGITATFDPENKQDFLKAMDEEVLTWQKNAFTQAEIKKAQRILFTRAIEGWQTAHGQAGSLASGEFYAGDPFFVQTYLNRLETVTPEDLQRITKLYLNSDAKTTVCLLPQTTEAQTESLPPALLIPTVKKELLTSGIPVLTMENSRLPLVNICVILNGGLRYETAGNNGITSMMAELLARGSPGRSAEKIADLTDDRGGSLSAYIGQNSFGLQAQCLPEDAGLFMELLTEGLLKPTFETSEIEKRRTVQLAEIAQQQESPVFLAQQALLKMLFPCHPYQFMPAGSPDSVAKLTAKDLREHHKRLVVAGNMVLAIFGDITHTQALALAEKHLRSVTLGQAPAVERTETPSDTKRVALSRQQAPKEQTIIMQGFPGVSILDSRLDKLNLLQTLLSGLSSDLMINVRDKEGLAYFTGALNRPGVEPGFFAVYAGIHHSAIERVQELFAAELKRLTHEGARPEEINRAREQILAQHLSKQQLNSALALECALNELYGLGYDYNLSIEKRLREITAADLKDVAQSIFASTEPVISIVEPLNATESTESPK